MMAILPMPSFSLALLISLLFLSECSASHAAVPPAPAPEVETIIQCLTRSSVPRSIIFTRQSKNFTDIFSSPVQNARVILDRCSPKPLLIIVPVDKAHVQAAVLCSRQLNVQLRTRSGGHDYEGLSYSSAIGPFLMLDLHNMRSVSFETTSGGHQSTAWVESGATLIELYLAIASKSRTLAFPAGFYPTIGVGGHIAGGGIGTIMRFHGLAADNVIDIRIINANGQLLERESMGEDLFWALRGGGGASFGIILAYRIKLVEVPPKVTTFSKTIALSSGLTGALAKWQQVAYRADKRLYISATLSTTNKTVKATFSSLFLGEMVELIPIVEKSFPELEISAKDCKEMSWIETFDVFSSIPVSNTNTSFKVKSDIVTEPITESSWEKIFKYIIEGDEQPLMLIEPLGGKIAEIAETETPFPHRNGSKFVVQYILRWPEAGEKVAQKHINWLRKFYKFMSPFVSKNPRAAYLNFRDLDLGRNRDRVTSYEKARNWGSKYYKDNFERLTHVKNLTDPENFFKNEQSIPPLL